MLSELSSFPGCIASHCTGYSTVMATARTGCEMPKRLSATIKNRAKAPQKTSLDSADGPCLKKGGGVWSRVPKGMMLDDDVA